MIYFNYETDFELVNESKYVTWIKSVLKSEDKILGEVSYVFCDDNYLLNLNMKYLKHNTLTDVISFDYTENNIVSGDVFISIERVKENATNLNISFIEELQRVMSHGLLHYCGYKDKSDTEISIMRNKENEKINMFHVEP